MRPLATVLVDQSHRQAWSIDPDTAKRMNPANPADAGYTRAAESLERAGFPVTAHAEGEITPRTLESVDVLVLPHCATDEWESTTEVGSPVYSPAEIQAIEDFVRGGGGLVILAETEQAKYGNSLAEIAERFGITIRNATVQDPGECYRDVATWVLAQSTPKTVWDPWAGVRQACLYRAGALDVGDGGDAHVVMARTSPTASPAGAALIAGALSDLSLIHI